MAEYNSGSTGVLLLDKVTPVITALFEPLNLKPHYPGNGQAFIAISTERGFPRWKDVYRNLPALLASLSLETRYLSEDDLVPALRLLATHFRVHDDPAIHCILEHHHLDGFINLDTLFQIATRFNDGHGLKAIKLENARYCTDLVLNAFGGTGYFIGKKLFVVSTSYDAIALGEDLYTALQSGDLDEGAARFAERIHTILQGIYDPAVRRGIHWRLADRLLASIQDATRRS